MSPAPAQQPPPLFDSLEDWYQQVLAVTVQRRLEAAQEGTLTWCPHWWEHPEGIARLEALWRAWEVCRFLDGEAPARWWWQHHDPIFAVLSHPKLGPFADCKPDKHASGNVTQFLPIVDAPVGHWGYVAQQLAFPA